MSHPIRAAAEKPSPAGRPAAALTRASAISSRPRLTPACHRRTHTKELAPPTWGTCCIHRVLKPRCNYKTGRRCTQRLPGEWWSGPAMQQEGQTFWRQTVPTQKLHTVKTIKFGKFQHKNECREHW